MNKETCWTFETARFRVVLTLEPDIYYSDYEGEELGEYDVAFNSEVTVYFNDVAIGSDSLYSSVYPDDHVKDFWTAHRDPQPMFRNCTTMRAAHGDNVIICHYFPSMVRQAVKQAREFLATAKL
jgi:hypothetical protein